MTLSQGEKPSILVCGGDGQLGSDLTRLLATDHPVTSMDLDLDITDPAAVKEALARIRPDIIVNCAAYTAVDACETHKELSHKVNADGPANLAGAGNEMGCRLIHISTDYVFDGEKPAPAPYDEEDPVNPLSWYGKTKLDGEAAVRDRIQNHLILRTSWLYGARGPNFLKTMLRLALSDPDREIRVVNDQFGSPTWSRRLAQQIQALIPTEIRGVHHATAEGHCTWFELAGHFLQRMDVPHTLTPIPTEEFPTPARRPMNSILENRALKNQGVNVMKEWRSDVNRYVEQYKERLLEEAVS
ncbi:MAG: dTDP-4-dehydrorhamnose reductase [Desulfobacterales bacterium]|nr:dTDP-4-dehydrorhamnose reductase [Desulfobacterales bacterium]